jgi:phosphate transport system protein
MQPHTIASYDAELKVLDGLIGEMADRSQSALEDAAKALFAGDVRLAQQVIAGDTAIDLLQHRVEEKAISIIATRQPVAIDLRQIVSAIRIAGDLERIGDLAKNVAKRVVAIGEQPASIKVATSLAPLAERVRDQLANVAAAYRNRDDGVALEVWRSDGAIDALHTSLFRELLTYMMEDPRSIGGCAHLLFCAKNLERIGDHATNIAETTHYLITGWVLSADRPKADGSSGVDPSEGPSWGQSKT